MNFVSLGKARVVAGVLVAGMMGLAGCATNSINSQGNSSGGGNTLAAGGATVLYALQDPTGTSAQVLQYSLSSSNNNLTPVSALSPPSGQEFTCVATDSSGQLYVGAYNLSTSVGEIYVYAAGASGTTAPLRTLTGTFSGTTTFGVPISMQVNSSGTLGIFSYNGLGYNFATLPASTPTGNVTPTTLIASTLFYEPESAALDNSGKVYVTDQTSAGTGVIYVFAAGSTGNVAPTSTITTATNYVPFGVATDASGNIYAVLDSTGTASALLVEYPAGANGAATPTKTITGSATSLYFGGGIRLDSVGNIYAIDENSSQTGYFFLGYPPTASGNAAPGLTIGSSYLTSPDAEIAVH